MGTTTPTPDDWKEWRRLRAWELKRQGWSQHDIAVALGASKGAVSKWIHAADDGGTEALRSHTGPGHPAKLTSSQKSQIPEFLWHGAEAYGFRGEVWTCTRVAQVIEWELRNKDSLLDFWHRGDTWTQPEVNDFIQRLLRV